MQEIIFVLSRSFALSSLIVRTLRCQQIYCMPLSPDTSAADIRKLSAKGMKGILWASEPDDCDLPEEALLSAGVPVLVLGGGAIALCRRFGGQTAEDIPLDQSVTFGFSQSVLFTDMGGGERKFHGGSCLDLTETLTSIATATQRCIGFEHPEQVLFALQYPMEHNDPDTARILYNFACHVCGVEASWDEESVTQRTIQTIREAAGDGRVLCAVSGGVDSAVCAKLAHMAVEERLDCMLIDTGFFREGEPEEILHSCRDEMGIPVQRLDAKARFMKALEGIKASEEKEKRITELLNEILQEQYASSGQEACTIMMGTNFDDVFYQEPSPQALFAFSVKDEKSCRYMEPMADLLKEEIRGLALFLSLPVEVAQRKAFPAGGLAMRIEGEVTAEKLGLCRAADAIFLEEIHEGKHEKRLSQYYATLMMPSEAASEKGGRISLCALQSAQGSAYAARLPYDVLERATQRILAEVPAIYSVVYELTPRPHA